MFWIFLAFVLTCAALTMQFLTRSQKLTFELPNPVFKLMYFVSVVLLVIGMQDHDQVECLGEQGISRVIL